MIALGLPWSLENVNTLCILGTPLLSDRIYLGHRRPGVLLRLILGSSLCLGFQGGALQNN